MTPSITSSDWVPLSSEHHRDWFWQPNRQGLRFASELGLVPVNHQELIQLIGQFVLAIEQSPQGLRLVALLSLVPGTNAYVDGQGKWRAPYVPARLRAYPFGLQPTPDGQRLAALDPASGLFDPQGLQGQPLFNDQAQPTPEVAQLLKFLNQVAQAETRTESLCQQLNQAGLLKPWRPIAPSHATSHHPHLQEINPSALAKLEADPLHALHTSGALQLAHALLLSKARLTWLGKYHEAQAASTQAPQPAAADLESLFDGQDDILRF